MADTARKPIRIVWAVDPLGEEPGYQVAGAEFLAKLGERASVEVFPIYLYGSYPLEYPLYEPPALDPAVRAEAMAAMAAIRERHAIAGLKDLEILVAGYTSLKEGVVKLVEHAEALEVDAVFATTHARKGVSRWIIGSFAEALMERSTVPLLILNPESKVEWRPDAALFATDFSTESRSAFRKFLPFARALRAKVSIYHQKSHPLSEGVAPAFGGVAMTMTDRDHDARSSESFAQEWRGVAESEGVEAEMIVDPKLALSPADGALAKAEDLGAWIAIAAQGKPVPVAIFGSNARHILRDSRVPVWLYRAPRNAFCDPIELSEKDIARDLRLEGSGEEEGR